MYEPIRELNWPRLAAGLAGRSISETGEVLDIGRVLHLSALLMYALYRRAES